jgi:hypothetical protein
LKIECLFFVDIKDINMATFWSTHDSDPVTIACLNKTFSSLSWQERSNLRIESNLHWQRNGMLSGTYCVPTQQTMQWFVSTDEDGEDEDGEDEDGEDEDGEDEDDDVVLTDEDDDVVPTDEDGEDDVVPTDEDDDVVSTGKRSCETTPSQCKRVRIAPTYEGGGFVVLTGSKRPCETASAQRKCTKLNQ